MADEAALPWPSHSVSRDDARTRALEAALPDCATLAFRVAFSVLRHREDAEDVAQEVLLKALRSLRDLRDPERLRPWLVRATFRRALDHRRADVRRAHREEGATPGGRGRNATPPRPSSRARVFRAVDELPGEAAARHRPVRARRPRQPRGGGAARHRGGHGEVATPSRPGLAPREAPMSDDPRLREAEEALRDALRVEPSEALVARVRADASVARPRRVAVRLGAVAAVLLVGAVAASVLGRAPDARGPERRGVFSTSSRRHGSCSGRSAPETPGPSREAQVSLRARPASRSRPVIPERACDPPRVRRRGDRASADRSKPWLASSERGRGRDRPAARRSSIPRRLAASLLEPASVEVQPLDHRARSSRASALSPLGRGDS